MIDEDGNNLPWDSLWEYLLGDEELDSVPRRGRNISRRRHNGRSHDAPMQLNSPTNTGGRSASRVTNRSFSREFDCQAKMLNVHSMTSEKTSHRSNARYETRNDQLLAATRHNNQSEWNMRDKKDNEQPENSQHYTKATINVTGEIPKKIEGERDMDGKNSHVSRVHASLDKGDASSFNDDSSARVIRLQYTPQRPLSTEDQKIQERGNDHLRTDVSSSQTSMVSSNHVRSEKGDPLVVQSRYEHETDTLDPFIQAECSTERIVAQCFASATSRDGAAHRGACRSIRNLSESERILSMKAGIPIYQLSRDDLIEMFPKLVAIADKRVEVIGRSSEFQSSIPAHLQASLANQGEPQLLYEYNYESEEHKFVSYRAFNASPLASMHVETRKIGRSPSVWTVDVLIQVEASTVSPTDCFIRQGKCPSHISVPLPNTPGVDAVGKIYRIDKRSSQRYKLVAGDRIMSLVNWGGNARYLQIDPAKAVKISETVDPVSAVCLAETYLAAYQILFHGIVGAKRQKKGSLGGKTYMLSGLIDPKLARAIAAIAKYAGVHAIYASAKCKYNRYFQKLGIVPFDQERDDLTAAKKGKFDRLVSFHQDLSKSHFDVLKKEGDIIVVCGIGGAFESREPSKLQPNIFCSRYKSQHYGKTYNYDVFEEWAERNEQCKSDLSFLVGLLSKGIIAPHIHHRISLRQVGKAQEMLESKQFSGFIVCEPWLVSKSRALRL